MFTVSTKEIDRTPFSFPWRQRGLNGFSFSQKVKKYCTQEERGLYRTESLYSST